MEGFSHLRRARRSHAEPAASPETARSRFGGVGWVVVLGELSSAGVF